MENLQRLFQENQKLKVTKLKESAGSNKPLKKKISELESEFNHELGQKTLLIKEKERKEKQMVNELKRMKMKLKDSEIKMKLREEEISLLEEKILGLQKNIR